MARGKNFSELTLAADASQAEKGLKDAAKATQNYQMALDEVAAAAKRADSATSGIESSTSRLSQIAGKGGADFSRYRSDLDGVGEGFNDIEDRAMGAGNIINGFSDTMKGTSQGTATFAMGLSDLAAGVRYTVVPTLQDGLKSIKGMAEGFKNSGGAVAAFKRNLGALGVGAAVAGITALALAVEKYNDAQQEANIERGTAKFVAAGQSFTAMTDTFETLSGQGFAEVFGVFDKLAATNTVAAERFIDTAEAAGVSEAVISKMRESLATTSAAEAQMAEDTAAVETSIRSAADAVTDYVDRLNGSFDPVFAFTDAQRSVEDAFADQAAAQKALADAINEHGANSDEAAQATRDLGAATDAAAQSLIDQRTAGMELDTAIRNGTVNVGAMTDNLHALEDQGYGASAAAQALRDQIALVQSKSVTLVARDEATGTIDSIRRNLDNLNGREATTFIRTLVQYRVPSYQTFGGGYAEGGVVYANRGLMVGGPRGTDTVPAWLTPGEMVLNRGQQQNLFDMIDSGGAGGGTVNVYVQGSIRSDQDLVKVITDAKRRGALV